MNLYAVSHPWTNGGRPVRITAASEKRAIAKFDDRVLFFIVPDDLGKKETMPPYEVELIEEGIR